MAEAIVLGNLELDYIVGLAIDESRKVVVHHLPGSDSDVVQDLGMAAARIRLKGVATGERAGSRLEELRTLMREGKPQDFTSSASIASQIDQVVITALRVLNPPGIKAYYEFEMDLIQYLSPPSPSIDGFDAHTLAAINQQVESSALNDVINAGNLLGTLEEQKSKVAALVQEAEDAMSIARAAIETVQNAVEVVKGLEALEKVLRAAGKVVKVGCK